jgi:hypothetical protein
VAVRTSSNKPAELHSGDVAVVGSTHITKDELDHEIKLEVRSLELGSESCTGGSQGNEICTTQKGTVPTAGTAAYRTTIVKPVITYLVTYAELQDIGQELSVVVTPPRMSGPRCGRTSSSCTAATRPGTTPT